MSQTPAEIRADIERKRREVGGDVDALAQKVSPSAAVDRQKTRVRHGLHRIRANVMGTADDVGTSMGDATHRAGEAVMHAPDQAMQATRGNPLAAGLVAFGVGAILSSLLPPSEKEKEAAALLKEKVEPVTEEVKSAVSEVAHGLQEPAQEAATAVKESATESFETVRDEAKSGAESVKEGGTPPRRDEVM